MYGTFEAVIIGKKLAVAAGDAVHLFGLGDRGVDRPPHGSPRRYHK